MKNYFTLSLFLFCCTFSLAQAPIWAEDFDGANTTNSPIFSEQCADDRDYFDIVCQNGVGCANEINSDFALFNSSGQYFGIRDADADPCTSTFPKTLSFNGIDISACAGPTNVTYICFDLAESRNMGDAAGAEWSTSNMREDTWDGSSTVSFTANIDGAGAQQITAIEDLNGSDTRPGIDVNCDGKSDDAGEPELTDTFTKYCFELSGQGTALDIVITVDGLNTGGEDLAIDNIEVYCESSTANLPAPPLAACTPFVYVAVDPNAIWCENFDGANTTNPPVFSEQCADDRDYFDIVCQDGIGCANEVNSDFALFNASGQYFGIRDADADPCSSTFPKTLAFNGIDISACSGAANVPYICFDIAESRNMGDAAGAEWSTSNMREDTWDSNSSVSFTADIDGGGAQQITAIEAFTNSDTRPGIDVNCDGQADDAGEPELTDTFTTFCFELPTQGASLDLLVTADGLNTGGEDFAIDNIKVYCESNTANLPAAPLTACTPYEYVNPAEVWCEDFDGSNTTNPPVFSEQCADDRDYFNIVCQDGAGCPNEVNADFVLFNVSGQYFGVRDADADPCSGTFPKTLAFNGIDISSCAGAADAPYICFDMAESRNMGDAAGAEWSTSNMREDTWDSNSSVTFTADIDGGGAQQITAIEAFDNSDTRPGIDVDCDGTADDAGEPELTDTFTKYCFELPAQGASLDLLITVDGLNTGGEDFALDNIKIYCESNTANLPGTLLETCPNVTGCIDDTACNYDPLATEDDGSCVFATGCDVCDGAGGVTDNPEVGTPCDDMDATTENDTVQADCSCAGEVPVGCTLAAGSCAACPAGNDNITIDLATGEAFNDGAELCADFGCFNPIMPPPDYDNSTNAGTWTLPAGVVNAFAVGGINNLSLPNVVNGGCLTADINVISGTTPFLIEFRIENGTGAPGNGGQALVFDVMADGTGMCSMGGDFSTGTAANGFTFTPGTSYSVVVALADFSGGPVPSDIVIEVSNIALSVCAPNVMGCTDVSACNFDPAATVDDGSCLVPTGCDACDGMGGITDNPEPGDACDDGNADTINDTVLADCSCSGVLPDEGCTDPNATNFDPVAITDNGTCLYLCDEDPANLLDVSTSGGFDGGSGLSYGSPSNMGLFAGANDDFGGFIWNVNTAGLTNDDFCISIDYTVTGNAAAFPITLEFRIENGGCPNFPCPWFDFNTVVTGPGTYTFGGIVSSGNVGANGPFDPAGANTAIVAAIANFSGTPIGDDIDIQFSNLCVSTDCAAEPACAPNIIQFPADPNGN